MKRSRQLLSKYPTLNPSTMPLPTIATIQKGITLFLLGTTLHDNIRIFLAVTLKSLPRRLGLNSQLEILANKLCKNCTVKSDGLEFQVSDFESLFITSSFFEDYVAAWFKPKKNDVVIDVGAHIGKYTLQASKRVGYKGVVLAFEPNHDNYKLLIHNIKVNHAWNVIPLELAVWNQNAIKRMFMGSTSARSSLKLNQGNGFYIVNVVSLDKFLHGLTRVDWIKIDVEKAEVEALQGMEQLIMRFRPKIILEVLTENVEKTERFFEVRGYQMLCIYWNTNWRYYLCI